MVANSYLETGRTVPIYYDLNSLFEITISLSIFDGKVETRSHVILTMHYNSKNEIEK